MNNYRMFINGAEEAEWRLADSPEQAIDELVASANLETGMIVEAYNVDDSDDYLITTVGVN